jgi:uncharacterized protein (DUF1501 family)
MRKVTRPLRRIRRRSFLEWSAASLTAAGLGSMPLFLRRALAGPMVSGKKLLFIFLRGGADAVQMVIPYGDQGIPASGVKTYLQARPTLGVPPASAHDLNGFASLFPTMQASTAADSPQLGSIFHGTVDERGRNLAIVARVGYEDQNRSHFSSQQFWENGCPGDVHKEEGVLNRYITAYAGTTPLQAATLNGNQMVLMKGPTLIPVLRSIDDFALPSNVSLGTFPAPESPLGAGLKGAYGQSGFDPRIPYETETYATGADLLESLQFFEDNVRGVPYAPEPDAVPYYAAITDRAFAGYVQDCARLLKQVAGLQIVGCNQNGYDTHGSENTQFPVLAADLSRALTALYHDLKPIWNEVLVMTMSEFGRTSEENGNDGTDHGESSLMMLLGGGVRGGVYNCDASTWANGDLFSTENGRYVAHRLDFRAAYAEVIRRHLGDPQNRLDQIIPGYSALEAANKNGYFTPAGFLA